MQEEGININRRNFSKSFIQSVVISNIDTDNEWQNAHTLLLKIGRS